MNVKLSNAVRMLVHPNRPQMLQICLNRPEKANCFTLEDWKSLQSTFDYLDRSEKYVAGLIRSEGCHFSSGLDLNQLSCWSDSSELRNFKCQFPSKPLLSIVKGSAFASGFEFVFASKTAIGTSQSTFGFTNRKFGVPMLHSVQKHILRRISFGRAIELILTGKQISGQSALELRLIDHLVTNELEADRLIDQLLKQLISEQTVLSETNVKASNLSIKNKRLQLTQNEVDKLRKAINLNSFYCHGRQTLSYWSIVNQK